MYRVIHQTPSTLTPHCFLYNNEFLNFQIYSASVKVRFSLEKQKFVSALGHMRRFKSYAKYPKFQKSDFENN